LPNSTDIVRFVHFHNPMHFLPFNLDSLTPELVWGVFLRLLGGMYLIAIAQLYHQALPIAGTKGISPVRKRLHKIREDYPSWQRFIYFPTLLWLNSTDRALKGIILLGCCAALAVIYGGPLSGAALLVCWAVYLSLDIAIGLSYPWDCLLLEAGFLALLLPNLNALPELSITATPLPTVSWAFHLLVVRLMLGFGKTKFIGSSLKDVGYIKGFMVNVPMPNYLAWFAYRLPDWFFLFSLWFMVLVEGPIPLLGLVPGDFRVIAALSITALMLGIQLTTNFGFFNLLTIVLCVPLLDTKASLFSQSLVGLFYPWQNLISHSILLVLLAGALLQFPFNSWCTQTWMYWPIWLHIKAPWFQALLEFSRLLTRFRLVHAYGVFPPKSGPAVRWVPVIEGTRDGQTWEEYHYRYMTTTETTPPRFVAPYHPRLDHAVFYESAGTATTFIASTVGAGSPYEFSHSFGLDCLLQRLLEGEPTTTAFFRHNPFPEPSQPPIAVRVKLYRYEPTTLGERQQTGKWWHRKFVSTHTPETYRDERVWQQWLPSPEQFHWDAVVWKRRSPKVQLLLKTARTGNPDAIWAVASAGLDETCQSFWQNFVTPLADQERGLQHLPQQIQAIRQAYPWEQLQDFEMILARLSLVLADRLEPEFLIPKPRIKVPSYFHLGLLIHHIIAKGEAAYIAVLKDPTLVYQHLEDFSLDQGLFYLGIFWYDTLAYQARKFRVVLQLMSLDLNPTLPGFCRLIPYLGCYFEGVEKEEIPILQRQPNGKWQVIDRPLSAI
jgi:hypothetical protein